ncbi:MAG: sigma-70 family RNA polymerase sigma factor [Acidimicrobiia bacterium]|nr:sigma-70 family RNA polymerase sigma factor [Acidimicrobiia bacterium]
MELAEGTPLDAQQEQRESFTRFFEEAEPRLRHGLIARYGGESGSEAAADAMTYAWEHWDRISVMDNPVGYLYRVGRTFFRRNQRRRVGTNPKAVTEPWTEPALPKALRDLSNRQRSSVVLRHSFGWTYAEIAELLGVSVPTVQKHVSRGLDKLRAELKVGSHA